MTPLHLQMLLWYHTRAEPYFSKDADHAYSIAVKEHRLELLDLCLIEAEPPRPPDFRGSGYRTTARGKAYIVALLNLPLPVEQWVIPKD